MPRQIPQPINFCIFYCIDKVEKLYSTVEIPYKKLSNGIIFKIKSNCPNTNSSSHLGLFSKLRKLFSTSVTKHILERCRLLDLIFSISKVHNIWKFSSSGHNHNNGVQWGWKNCNRVSNDRVHLFKSWNQVLKHTNKARGNFKSYCTRETKFPVSQWQLSRQESDKIVCSRRRVHLA